MDLIEDLSIEQEQVRLVLERLSQLADGLEEKPGDVELCRGLRVALCDLAGHLSAHEETETKLLFPALRRRLPSLNGPTATLERELLRLEDLLNDEQGWNCPSAVDVRRLVTGLRGVLLRETVEVYPAANKALSKNEKASIQSEAESRESPDFMDTGGEEGA
jgi:hypothetical protein